MPFRRFRSLAPPPHAGSPLQADCVSIFCSRRAALANGSAMVAGGMAAAMMSSGALAATDRAAEQPKLVSSDYWAVKERNGATIRLAMYRKRLAEATADGSARPVLFLVHGSSISARPSFDLNVPGHGEYSLMNVFAYRGFDVWTMDHENYGRSSRTDGNSDVASGVEDLKAATKVVTHETGQSRLHMLGESSGALRAGAFAAAEPDRVGRLVLEAFTWTGRGSPTLSKRAEQVDFFRTHNMRPRDREMIRSIFTRDKAGTSDPAVADALPDAELQYGPSVPTGTYLDMTANLPLVDPTKVHAPVLLIRGEHDGIATLDDLLNFFKALPNPDRQFAIIPGAAHALTMSLNRQAFWHTVHAFLTLPQPTAA
jgi:alpha-beta hydrolase superfamily lysophospholipase